MDTESTRTLLPCILKVAELRAEGKTPEEVKRFVADAYARGVFRPPSRPGENVVPLDPEKGTVGHFPPHVTFYAPYLTNGDLGSQNLAWPAFVAGSGTPNTLIIVPVPEEASPGSGHERR